ncbi:MAG: serine/threonine-protein kinase [Thermoleophilia bacterium]
MTTAAQERLVGTWALEERIGGGGQAAVWRVRHAVLARHAALKLVHPAIWDDPGFRVRFRREVDALVALEHPSIVPILDAGEHEGRGYLVMALARGGSLDKRIAGRPLTPDEAVRIVTALASALDAAHAAGVLHRDVTPSNVLLDPLGPWLADFGLAVRGDATTLTGEGQIVGTAGYLAPEVIAGGRATPASDRYALAATAFRALTGEPPFAARGVAGTLYAHVHGTPRRASEILPELPPALDEALAWGLAREPGHRPPSAAALADALAAAVGGTAAPTRVAVVPPPPPAPAPTRVMPAPDARTHALVRQPSAPPRRRRRRGLLVGGLAAAAIVVAGGAAGALTLTRDTPPPPPPPAENPRVTIPQTVPGPDGLGISADPAIAADLPGGVAIPGAVAATVGDVRVTAFPGGWEALDDVRARLEGDGYVVEGLPVTEGDLFTDPGPDIGWGARQDDILDILGQSERWAVMVLSESTGARALLVRGWHDAPAAYARALAESSGARVVAPPG